MWINELRKKTRQRNKQAKGYDSDEERELAEKRFEAQVREQHAKTQQKIFGHSVMMARQRALRVLGGMQKDGSLPQSVSAEIVSYSQIESHSLYSESRWFSLSSPHIVVCVLAPPPPLGLHTRPWFLVTRDIPSANVKRFCYTLFPLAFALGVHARLHNRDEVVTLVRTGYGAGASVKKEVVSDRAGELFDQKVGACVGLFLCVCLFVAFVHALYVGHIC
jgi:hypothetical protein